MNRERIMIEVYAFVMYTSMVLAGALVYDSVTIEAGNPVFLAPSLLAFVISTYIAHVCYNAWYERYINGFYVP